MLARFLLLLLVLAPLGAQVPIAMPRIEVRQGDTSLPARLHDLHISVKVVGHLATTTWDMTVANPQERVLEGELVFPLGEGQTLTRFAMDVNGRLREGVVVEKAKGRIAFEDTVRQGVDPGLLEKTSGNAFRARVYPIPAQGYKRLVVAYEQELPDAGAQGLLYRLPLAFKDKVDTFGLRVEVLEQPAAPRTTSSPLANFAFKAVQRAYVAEEVRHAFAPEEPLAVVIPKAEESGQVFVEEKDGAIYFHVMAHPRVPREPKVLPRRLLVAWDASASARNRDLKRELALLDAYLKRLGTCEVQLALFRNEAEPVATFRIEAGDSRALRARLANAPLDGGTCLGALDLEALKVDETLLFSDGVQTFGPLEARLPAAPLVAINSALVADHGRLRVLSEGRGGEYVNLQNVADGEALKALTTVPLAFLKATCGQGRVEDVVPGSARVVRGPFGVAGRLMGNRARLTLHFGFGARERFTRSFDLDAALAAEGGPVARIWAQKKVAELELDPTRNAKAILALGQAYGLVTEGTSLIVLDTVEDYLRCRIPPPAELRAEYERQATQALDETRRLDRNHLDALARKFEERKAWWRTAFKAPPGRIASGDARAGVSGGGAAGSGAVMMAPAPPPPPPHAMQEQLQADRSRANHAGSVVEVVAQAAAPDLTMTVTMGKEAAASILLRPWNPDTPYLKELKAAPKPGRYALYLKLRETAGGTPGFFLDVAELFREQGEPSLALRILTNLAELRLEDPSLLRVLGYRLRQLGLDDLAVWTFEDVLRLREEEPQSRRDLALACAGAKRAQRALDLLWEVAKGRWSPRFPDVNLIALGELNALAATAQVDASAVDARFLAALPVDIRVVLNWDTDASDMDLHVVDPRGEECFYGHNRTALGGRLSADVTQGYGPEEFLLKKAIPGTYRVKANFFGTRQQTAIGATTVVLELYLRYGTGRVENKSTTIRLDGANRMVDIGAFAFSER